MSFGPPMLAGRPPPSGAAAAPPSPGTAALTGGPAVPPVAPPVIVATPPPPANFRAALADRMIALVPAITAAQTRAAAYIGAVGHKAIVVTASGQSWFSPERTSESEAEQHALEGCQVRHGEFCRLVATNEALRPPPEAGAQFGVATLRVAYAGTFNPAHI